MTKWAPQKVDVLDALAAEVLHNYGRGRVAVAIDGDDPAVSASFADDLAAALARAGHGAFVAHLSDFQRPRAEREDASVPEEQRAYRLRYDYELLRRVLLDPFKLGGSTGFVLAAFDAVRDEPRQPRWRTAGRDAVLLVDGEFALRPELRGAWNLSIRLDTQEPPVDAAYRASTDARRLAPVLVDIRDPEHPRRVFADSC
jgi:uridine kinase